MTEQVRYDRQLSRVLHGPGWIPYSRWARRQQAVGVKLLYFWAGARGRGRRCAQCAGGCQSEEVRLVLEIVR